MHGRTTVLAALPLSRHATSAAADVATSHRALDGAVLPIEGARTHAHAISTGALAVFRAFQHAQLAGAAGRREASSTMHDHLRVQNAIEILCIAIFAARALLPRRLAHWKESRLLNPESRCSNPGGFCFGLHGLFH
jgi:hypothetical protein